MKFYELYVSHYSTNIMNVTRSQSVISSYVFGLPEDRKVGPLDKGFRRWHY